MTIPPVQVQEAINRACTSVLDLSRLIFAWGSRSLEDIERPSFPVEVWLLYHPFSLADCETTVSCLCLLVVGWCVLVGEECTYLLLFYFLSCKNPNMHINVIVGGTLNCAGILLPPHHLQQDGGSALPVVDGWASPAHFASIFVPRDLPTIRVLVQGLLFGSCVRGFFFFFRTE